MTIKSNESQGDMPSIIIEDGTTAVGPNVDLLTPGTGRVYAMKLDNSTGGGTKAYFKIYDAKAVTAGSTAPDFVFKCTPVTSHWVSSRQGIKINTALSTALSDEGGSSSSTGFSTFKYTIFGD
jgi:hypothetical protein